MPVIVFEAGQLQPEVKAELLRRLTDVAVEVTGIPRELYIVAIHELPDDDIAVGGVSVRTLKERLARQRADAGATQG